MRQDLFKEKALEFAAILENDILKNKARPDSFSVAINEPDNLILVYEIDKAINWATIPNLPRDYNGTRVEYHSMGRAIAH